MVSVRWMVIPLALILTACQSEDPRLPQQLYDEAIHLNQDGKQVEARALMAQLAQKYPDNPVGQQAMKDLYLMDALMRQAQQERDRHLRGIMQRTADALTRYKAKHGEYPRFLTALVPDYLEKEPETPWGHPFFYKPFVGTPILNIKDKRGRSVQILSNKLDSYHLASLGVDLQPGGDGEAADTLMVNGDFIQDKVLPPLPVPQPVR